MVTRIKEVTFRRASMDLVIEPETMRDYITFLQDEGETLGTLFGDDMEKVVSSVSTVPIATLEEAGAPGAAPAAPGAEPPKTRKRKGADPAAAVAPPPIPVPTVPTPPFGVAPTALPNPPAAPNLAIPADGGIPAFLDRTAQTPTPPAPPLLPNAPPVAPTPPVSGPVTARVVAELQRRASGSADGGKGLVTWLAAPGNGFVVASASFDEAIAVLHQLGDERVGALLGPLGVA